MLHELACCTARLRQLAARRRFLRALRDLGDEGYSTETIIVTALLVIMAIAAIAIISAKVIAKANSIGV
jgi:hypothetical protein